MLRTTSSLVRIATALMIVAGPIATLAAQEPDGVIRPRTATTITRIPVEQVRAIIASHLPAVTSGASDDNLVTLIFDSNGEFVSGGSAKVDGPVVVSDGNAEAGLAVRRIGVGGSASAGVAVMRDREPGADSVLVGSVARARVRSADGPSRLLQVEGVGEIDSSLIHEMYMTSYAAGQISANAVRLRVIRLNGTSLK